MFRGFPRDRYLSGERAEGLLGVPTLGFIPQVREEGFRQVRDLNTFSALSESFRWLRAQLSFVDPPAKSLLVASSQSGEGRSHIVANLATTLVLGGKRVVVVDADLRAPAQHRIHRVRSSPGLVDVLIKTHSLASALLPICGGDLCLLPAGTSPPNPAEQLGSEAMKQVLAELEDQFDIVLLDSSPVLAAADTQVLASRVGGILLVVGNLPRSGGWIGTVADWLRDATPFVARYAPAMIERSRAALQVLYRTKTPIVGTVFVGVRGPMTTVRPYGYDDSDVATGPERGQ